MVGQLFQTNQTGHLIPSTVKTFETLEAEFNIVIPVILRNSISTLVRQVKQSFRTTIASSSALYETVSTLQSLIRAQKSGCGQASRLLLQQQRSQWQWGQFPRSFATYVADNMINITSREFSKALATTRTNLLPPSNPSRCSFVPSGPTSKKPGHQETLPGLHQPTQAARTAGSRLREPSTFYLNALWPNKYGLTSLLNSMT